MIGGVALERLLTGDVRNMPPALPDSFSDGCNGCPFAKLSAGQSEAEIAHDRAEAYFDCSLVGEERIWGEDPKCKIADWQRRAREELARDACPPDHEALERLRLMPDSEIDTSDIPEQLDWSGAERGRFARYPGRGFLEELRPQIQRAQWEPNEISPGRWQAMRETGDGLSRYRHFDTAVEDDEGGLAQRKAMIYPSRGQCETRCFELNRRLRIG